MLFAITGGVATGKSTVAALFRSQGVTVFSADQAARDTTRPGSPVLDEISSAFGNHLILSDGSLDRKALGSIVFQDAEARERLERITHPPILAQLDRQIDEARRTLPPNSLIAVEVPLLFEVGMDSRFDSVVVVAASEATQIGRLRTNRGLSDADARSRIAAQMDLSEKIRRADHVIWNDGSQAELEKQVLALLAGFRKSDGE